MRTYPILKSTGIACLSVLAFLVFLRIPVGHASRGNADCLMCHSAKTLKRTADGEDIHLYVEPEAFASSVHGSESCVDCHADLRNQPLPHKPQTQPVQCARCHEAHKDSIHRAVSAKDDSPSCRDCHGYHYIPPKDDPASPIGPIGSEATCAGCHADGESMPDYLSSVHGAAGDEGRRRIAGCIDCHQAHTGIGIESPDTCAKCHSEEHVQFAGGSHGRALAAGNADAPTCVRCHGSHDIRSAGDPVSRVFLNRIALSCSECHEDHTLMQAHNLPSDRLKSYEHSFHGAAMRFGSLTTATCVSCHTAHDVRSSGDPKSSTHPNNLPETCGRCHQRTNLNWSIGQQHVVISKDNKDVLYYVSNGFILLTVGVMAALIGHITLDLFAHVRGSRRSRRRTGNNG